ncbi:hypothetical protein [Sphingomonas sp. SFZ2018-12]|nr:hypothetical protein [Sphingomonas sp. SFZ2018-12]
MRAHASYRVSGNLARAMAVALPLSLMLWLLIGSALLAVLPNAG